MNNKFCDENCLLGAVQRFGIIRSSLRADLIRTSRSLFPDSVGKTVPAHFDERAKTLYHSNSHFIKYS